MATRRLTEEENKPTKGRKSGQCIFLANRSGLLSLGGAKVQVIGHNKKYESTVSSNLVGNYLFRINLLTR